MLTIRVLGSAAGGGFPQWNCRCEGCRRARAGDPAATPRTQSSLAVSGGDGRWLIINASPDIRQQLEAAPPLHPQHGIRHSPVAAVLLTNADVDHITGLLTLREMQAFPVYATERVHTIIGNNSVFNVLNSQMVARRVMALNHPFVPSDATNSPFPFEVEVFAVPGKVALWLEDSNAPNFGSVSEDTVAVMVTDRATGKRFFHIPGCAALPDWLGDRLRGTDLVFFDGTTWTEEEMIHADAGSKTAQRMGHMAMSGPDGSMAAFGTLGVGRKIYIHINNTNPVLLADSAQRAAAERAGWEIAFDGMEITL